MVKKKLTILLCAGTMILTAVAVWFTMLTAAYREVEDNEKNLKSVREVILQDKENWKSRLSREFNIIGPISDGEMRKAHDSYTCGEGWTYFKLYPKQLKLYGPSLANWRLIIIVGEKDGEVIFFGDRAFDSI
jgi:hypothetical protein